MRKEITYIVNDNNCWLCTSHRPIDKKGYMRVTINGKFIRLHRFMYEKYKGNIPNGLELRHTCDIPGCINPEHLLVGTHTDNMQDKVKRNRCNNALGENHGSSKLTEKEVIDIFNNTTLKQVELANKYNVTKSQISAIKKKRQWIWLTKNL